MTELSQGGRVERAPVDLTAEEFRALGHRMVDDVAALLDGLRDRPVTPGLKPSEVRALLGGGSIPEHGTDASTVLAEATRLLFESSTFNGHPRFFGYITASATPVGILGEMLAAAVNPNCGAWALSPMATEIELQTVRWLSELTGFPRGCGGLFVSGGNMANIVCFLAAKRRAAETPLKPGATLRCYASAETHTWIDKALDMTGLGADSLHRLPIDSAERVSAMDLREAIASDRRSGSIPFLVIATAGTTNTGAIDPIDEIAEVCRDEGVWLHVDGAYGAPVAALPDAPADLRAIGRADSLAIDPHKWLYAPLEAGCALVRDPSELQRTFSHTPHYYHFDDVEGETGTNFYELGPQNSRGFRALKVWLAMKQVGRSGHAKMIAEDIALARQLDDAVRREASLEAFTCELSIVTFRFVPPEVRGQDTSEAAALINDLNEQLLSALQSEGEVFLSNATIGGRFLLRACIVNFRTTTADVLAVPEIVVRTGERVYASMKSGAQNRATVS